jgi:hypothetical protein
MGLFSEWHEQERELLAERRRAAEKDAEARARARGELVTWPQVLERFAEISGKSSQEAFEEVAKPMPRLPDFKAADSRHSAFRDGPPVAQEAEPINYNPLRRRETRPNFRLAQNGVSPWPANSFILTDSPYARRIARRLRPFAPGTTMRNTF